MGGCFKPYAYPDPRVAVYRSNDPADNGQKYYQEDVFVNNFGSARSTRNNHPVSYAGTQDRADILIRNNTRLMDENMAMLQQVRDELTQRQTEKYQPRLAPEIYLGDEDKAELELTYADALHTH